MDELKTIFLIVGKSGSGKSTLCDYLSKSGGLKQIVSYTTRPPRFEGEDTHLFVDSFEGWAVENSSDAVVGYTQFAGYKYWATSSQVDENDLYVIDPSGVDFFRLAYTGNKGVKVIYIDVPLFKRIAYMKKRGDSISQIIKRVINDWFAFNNAKKKADTVFKNENLAQCVADVSAYIARHADRVSVNNPCPFKHTGKCLHCSDGYDDDGEMYCAREHNHANLI